jgi:hypothetical protein
MIASGLLVYILRKVEPFGLFIGWRVILEANDKRRSKGKRDAGIYNLSSPNNKRSAEYE